MSGQASARGYIVQTLIGVLDSLEDREWDFLSIEPNIASDKVDVIWYYPERTKVVQVKHSQNQINLGMVKAWAEELEKSLEAQEYELTLIGPCNKDVASTGLHGKVSIPKPHVLNLSSLIEQAAHKLAKYLESKNIRKTTSQVRELLVEALTTKLSIYSTKGSRISRDSFDNLLVEWIEIIYPDSTNETDSASLLKKWNIPWSEVCSAILENQNQWLTTHALASGNRRVKDMYLPLGLVERKQPSRPERNISPEQGSEFYQEKITPIEHKDFFEQVLKLGISPKSNGRCIAIIGEPGAGKTTLLQKIASEVEGIPIWVDLADPDLKREENLKDYLVNKWLEEALPYIRKHLPDAVSPPLEVTQEVKDAFKQEFYQGRVWLLLDGADEIAAEFGNPLTWISRQIRGGWISEARVVLTCRLNVWDADRNALDANFDVYRNLDFSYPEQVEDFIDKWFAKESEQQSRDNLKAELNKAGERIKNLVKNPLWLMLLCRTWEVGGKLPDTKAGLYQRLVKGLYQLKDDNPEFEISPEEQDELNRKLGELALQAIDGEDSRFRLRESFIKDFLGHPEQKGSLFRIARKLGWLNQVGLPMVEEKDYDENVYAFFHATFQEYFAACAIPEEENWNFFMNYQKGIYRIFEPHWREVILLWLGRDQMKLPDKQKEQFIQSLMEFDDECGDFYKFRAYFLAAAAIAEFGDCTRADEIVAQVAGWAFGNLKVEKYKWQTLSDPIPEGARVALRQTERGRAIAELVKLIRLAEKYLVTCQSLKLLGEIGIGNSQAIKNLEEIIELADNKFSRIHIEATAALLKIHPNNAIGLKNLLELITQTEYEPIRKEAIEVLGRVGTGQQEFISVLEQIVEQPNDYLELLVQAANSLGKIAPSNPKVVPALVSFIEPSEDEINLRQSCENFRRSGRSDFWTSLYLQLNQPIHYENARSIAFERLEKIALYNSDVIPALLQVINFTKDEDICCQAIGILGRLGRAHSKAITTLEKFIEPTKPENIRRIAAESLEKIYPNHPRAIADLVQLTKSAKDENIRWLAARSLGEIGKGNSKAIAALEQFIKSREVELSHRLIAESLWKIDPDNPIIIQTLEKLIEPAKDERTRRLAAESLGRIYPNHPKAIAELVKIIKSTEDEAMRRRVADSLNKILREEDRMIEVVAALKEYLSDESRTNNRHRYRECYKVIWHCAQNMSYQKFRQA